MAIPKFPPKVDFSNKKKMLKLLKAQDDPKIKEFIEEQNEKYHHWDEIRHFVSIKGFTPEELWQMIKISRKSKYASIEFGKDKLKFIITNRIMETLHKLDQQTGRGLPRVSGDVFLSKEQREKYLINSLMEEAIATSQLEGAATTRKVAKEMLRRGRKPRDESEQMIANAYKTILYILEIKDEELSPRLILGLHKKITENTLDEKHVGKFRDNDEVIVTDASGEVFHQPPSFKKINELVGQICEFANREEEFLHPVIKAIILHFMIGYVHPFENGNGRCARALFYWYALKKGYWLFEFMPISKAIKKAPAKYATAYLFTETDDLDLTYFLYFNFRQINIAMKEFFDYLENEIKEFERIKGLISEQGLNFRQTEIVMSFIKNPTKLFTLKEIMNTYSVTYETTRSDLIRLEELSYCEKSSDGKKFYYSYKEKK